MGPWVRSPKSPPQTRHIVLNATVETTVTYSLSVKDIEDIILKEAGVERSRDVTIQFDVSDSDYSYDSFTPARLNGVKLIVKKKGQQ